jgi:UDP-glucose 4-epimerase
MLAAVGKGGTFNISTGIETDVLHVLEVLQRAAGTEFEPELVPLREGELERSGMDPSRAERELGWRAETPLDDGLKQTYNALIGSFEAKTA